ncbi:DNA polymerase I [Thermosipho atlanticus]|uniref:DNA polymerase I n=1 Tax=Thermosipho atlanticus DSM 15807 TaxID=1123380 RepID=A0A1M5SHC9_9BACT|nr:DNA polymerase I [Thermosipho atlanticus]SHH37946.1 DNA polymerase I [Thermosipho atlanticus DSM 15807]
MAKMFLFDGTGLVYRAFYALDRSLKTSTGLHTNAVYGLTKMIIKFLKKHINTGKDACAFVLDSKGGSTFRKQIMETYKANRPETPDLLLEQIPYIVEMIEALGIKVLKIPGYEADDIIATMTMKFSKEFEEINIVTGDKDLLQLVKDNVFVWRVEKGITDIVLYTKEKVYEKYGIYPNQFVDYLALVGDPIDNIPGVKGIGKKTAVSLLKKFGNIENIVKNINKLTPKLKDTLEKNRNDLEKSLEVAKLLVDAPINLKKEEFIYNGYNPSKLLETLKKFEFSSVIRELNLYSNESVLNYSVVNDETKLRKLKKELDTIRTFSIDSETTSLDPFDSKMVGISIATSEGKAYYIPVSHKSGQNVEYNKVIEFLKTLLESENYNIVGQNLKYDYKIFKVHGIEPKVPHFDTMIAAYLLNPNEKKFNLEELALKFLGYKMTSFDEVVNATTPLFSNDFSYVPIEKAAKYSCEDADITYRLFRKLSRTIFEKKLDKLFHEIELPLINVLAEMEINGVYFDKNYLENLSNEYGEKIRNLQEQIYEIAGEQFNLNSSKQVAHILFEKLNIPTVKKTNKGSFSTDAEVLEILSGEYEIAKLILEYRKLQKLKSTYLDTLPKEINPKTGRIHSSFHQTGTATGRLSSSEPNLQNLPTRSEEGKEIRKAIRPQFDDWWIVGADYSQIELRILAHVSEDKNLIEAFNQNLDIHSITAAKIFGISESFVTEQMRRIGKMVNFAIVYGISPYGLSKRIGLSVSETKKIIDNYFKFYSGVFKYIKNIKEFAKQHGYVETLFGRKREVPQLRSSNGNIRNEGERIAINTPIQGTAADIIKIAMIRIYEQIKRNKLKSKMILQVHDELVFEVPDNELEIMKKIIKNEMENAVKLKVPLSIELYQGKEWE